MKTSYVISVIVSSLLGGLAYFVTGSWVFLAAIFAISLLVAFCLLIPLYERCFLKRKKSHECFRFINSFVVSLSVTNSLAKAYDASIEGAKGELKEAIEENAGLEIYGRIRNLSFYFEADIYSMFLSVLDVYIDQGGNMLELSRDLLLESSRIEESMVMIEKGSSRHMFNYVVLNAMSLTILAFMRFGLTTFYSRISGSFLYLASIGFYFVFIIVSFVFYSVTFTNEKLRFPKVFGK